MREAYRKQSRIRQLGENIWPLLVLGLLVGVFFWRLIFLGKVFVPADLLGRHFPWQPYNPPGFSVHNYFTSDVIDSQYPARAVALDILRSGQLPLWDPYTSSGRPLGTLPVYALSFPLNLLLLLLPLEVGFSYAAVGRVFLAGVGMFAFLRQLKLSKTPALLGGIMFAFNGFIVVWLNATAGVTLSMAPLVFWAGERLFRRPSAVNVALLALSVAVLISGGFLQIVLYVLYFLTGYLVFRAGMIAWQSHDWRKAGRRLLLGGLAILIGITLMTPQLWSFWDHLRLTSYDTERASQKRGIAAEPLHTVIRFLIPDYYGSPVTHDFFDMYPERTAYLGIMPLFLAALGMVFSWRRHKTALFFTFSGLLALGMVYGAPFNRWVACLPGLNFSLNTRFKAMFAFCVAILAAFGLDFLQQRWNSDGTKRKVIGVTVLMLGLQGAVIVLTERYWGPGGPASHIFGRSLWWLWKKAHLWHHLFDDFLLYLLWTGGSLTLLIARAKGFISGRIMGLGALLLASLDLMSWGMSYNWPVDRAMVFPQTPGITFLQNDPDLFRVTGLDNVLPPNTPGVYRLQDIAGHDPLAPDRYRKVLQLIDPDTRFGVRGTIMRLSSKTANLRSPWLDLLNLKYVTDSPLAPNEELITQDGTFVRVYKGPDMTIYENMEALPRCYVVTRAEVLSDPEVILARLASGETDPREVILLEEEPPEPLSGAPRTGRQVTPEVVLYTANRVVIQVRVEAPAFLVLGDMYYPGWVARLDGQPTKIYRANYLFRAVFLPPGAHVVEFVFRPRPYYMGQAVRFLALLVMVAALLWEQKR